MDKRMIYLISLIAELSKRMDIPRVYSTKFLNSGNKYLSPTERIRIEDLTDYFVTAGIVGRDEILPIVDKNGFAVTEFEPDIIGAQALFSPSDIIQLQAGIPLITSTGNEIPTIKQLENKYSRIIAAALGNKFERMCAEAYLKGTYVDKDGVLINVGVTENKSLSFTAKTVYSDEILALLLKYHTKHGMFPKVEIGEKIFTALKNEANNSRQNINNVKFVFGEQPYLELGEKKIELLTNGKDATGEVIDTQNMIILSDPKGLAVGYGCLMYGDIKSNESKLIRAELIAGDTRVEETSGSKGLWGKSAPMPIVLSLEKFERYEVTFA